MCADECLARKSKRCCAQAYHSSSSHNWTWRTVDDTTKRNLKSKKGFIYRYIKKSNVVKAGMRICTRSIEISCVRFKVNCPRGALLSLPCSRDGE